MFSFRNKKTQLKTQLGHLQKYIARYPASEEKTNRLLKDTIDTVLDGLDEDMSDEMIQKLIIAILSLLTKLPETTNLKKIKEKLLELTNITENSDIIRSIVPSTVSDKKVDLDGLFSELADKITREKDLEDLEGGSGSLGLGSGGSGYTSGTGMGGKGGSIGSIDDISIEEDLDSSEDEEEPSRELLESSEDIRLSKLKKKEKAEEASPPASEEPKELEQAKEEITKPAAPPPAGSYQPTPEPITSARPSTPRPEVPAKSKKELFWSKLGRRRPKNLQRYGDISCPLKMQAKKEYKVEVCVRASRARVKGVASVDIQVAVPRSIQERPKIEVMLLAPGFDTKDEPRKTLEIPLENNDSRTLVYRITPQSVGEKYVFIEFYQHGKLLGRSVISVQVDQKLIGTPPLESKTFSLQTFNPQEVELDATLRIVKFENKFFFSLFTRHSAAIVDSSSMFGARELDSGQIDALQELMHTSAFKRDVEASESSLKELGQVVYKLIPSKMRQAIERTKPDFLLIETGDMFVPWELAYDGEDFWAIKYSLGKRIFDETSDFKAPPLCFGTTTVKSAIVSSSAGDLKFAEKEIDMFEKFAQTQRITIDKIIADRKKAIDSLKKGVNLWHYVGHGDFDEIHPLKSALLLSPPLSAEEISKIPIQGFPLVFANACEAGALQKESYGVAGIARSFLGSGAIAFLGPLWEIPDKIAAEFSIGFYQRLLYEGKHIGVAIRETKIELRERFPGVLWATFSLFGDPTLQICSPLSSS